MKRIAVLIPAYQPDIKLTLLCEKLFNHGIKDVLIVNDGSDAEYNPLFEDIKSEFGYSILSHEHNLGKGRALKDGMRKLLETDVDGCVTADADGQHLAADILTCIKRLEAEPDKFFIGMRDFTGSNIPFADRIWNGATKVIFRYLFGAKLSDSLCGLRGIPRSFMEEIVSIKGDRYEYETEVLIEATRRLEIVEFPIATIFDQKGHFTSRDSFEIYKIFAKVFLTFVFSSLSSSLIDLILFSVFCRVFRGRYPLAYVSVATVIARIISSIYNYVLNKRIVFRKQKKHKNSGLKYFVLAIVQMILSAAGVTGLVALTDGISETLLKAVVDIILFFTSYPIQQKYVFADKS